MAETALSFEFLRQIARRIQHVQGWRRRGAAVLAGLIASLGFAPMYAYPVVFLAFPVLVWLMDSSQSQGRDWRAAFATGWCFGFGLFLGGMHWIVFPFMVDPDSHAWQIPFVAVLFPGGLALFWAAAAVVASHFWRPGFARVLVLAISASGFEWLRGHVLTGLPWNLPGQVWSGSDEMIQTASVYGIYGLSLVTLIAASVPAAIVQASGNSARGWSSFGTSIGLLAALWSYGALRMPTAASPVFETVRLRLVQPDVPQNEKWRPELVMRNWKQLVDLTRQPGLETVSTVIWPEAAPPFFVLSTDGALEAIGSLLPDQTVLLTGTQRMQSGNTNRYFNSFVVLDGKGRLIATYDKSHLVPFGEYLPLFQLLEPLGITQLTGMHGGFSSGEGVRTLTAAGVPSFGVLICYEAIFPGEVVRKGERPAWLVNVTDDSWFGPWAGPYQHLGLAKVRAVEEGLAIARAANTGISAVIDPYGRIIASLGLNKSGVVDAPLPKPLDPTLYSVAGDAIFAAIMLVLVGVVVRFSRSTS
ncbi:MAG: apolipoprotein N-acyltransferase [Micropepsaceae bacterium]